MNEAQFEIPKAHVHKLLCAKSPDAALLYLYITAGNDPAQAEKKLQMSTTRYACAAATLRQMGLWPEARNTPVFSGERPRYTERDVLSAMDGDRDFKALYGEVQRALGRTLNTEELKILLGFTNYLGLPADVISVLVCYCKDRNRRRGNLRNPSLRTIEKEAYAWAERGIDTMEEAAAFIQAQNMRSSQIGQLMKTMQIYGRNLSPGEDKMARQWLEMGFDMDVFALAYDKTCLNTGGMSWNYMNRILTRWHEAGLHTLQEIRDGDKKPQQPKGASGTLGEAELEAIKNVLQEG